MLPVTVQLKKIQVDCCTRSFSYQWLAMAWKKNLENSRNKRFV